MSSTERQVLSFSISPGESGATGLRGLTCTTGAFPTLGDAGVGACEYATEANAAAAAIIVNVHMRIDAPKPRGSLAQLLRESKIDLPSGRSKLRSPASDEGRALSPAAANRPRAIIRWIAAPRGIVGQLFGTSSIEIRGIARAG